MIRTVTRQKNRVSDNFQGVKSKLKNHEFRDILVSNPLFTIGLRRLET